MTSEHDLINEVFETYLESNLSSKTHQAMVNTYGEEIASKAGNIYAGAMHCPVDGRTGTIDTALPILQDFLDSNYPWLSGEARKRINFAFIMTWK